MTVQDRRVYVLTFCLFVLTKSVHFLLTESCMIAKETVLPQVEVTDSVLMISTARIPVLCNGHESVRPVLIGRDVPQVFFGVPSERDEDS